MPRPLMNHSFLVNHLDSNTMTTYTLTVKSIHSYLFMHLLSGSFECGVKLCMDGVWLAFGTSSVSNYDQMCQYVL
jgi:hypothetical protein